MKTLERTLITIVFLLLLNYAASAQTRGGPGIISIQTSYAPDIPSSMKSKIDSTLSETVSRFNRGLHISRIAVNHASANQMVTLNITKGKLATKKQRKIAYAVNLIAPLYIPMHKIKSTVTIPSSDTSNSTIRPVKSCTHILVGKISRREDKMLRKYADKLLDELIYVDNEISRAAMSAVSE